MIGVIREFRVIIKIENHLNIKNDMGGILDIFINRSIKIKLGWGGIIENELRWWVNLLNSIILNINKIMIL